MKKLIIFLLVLASLSCQAQSFDPSQLIGTKWQRVDKFSDPTLTWEFTKTEIKYAVGESVFDALPERFTRGDLQAVVHRNEMKTPVKVILSNWKKLDMIVKRGENEWQKKP